MNKPTKMLMIAFIIAYIISPDPIAGPLDDMLLAVIGYVLNKKISEKKAGVSYQQEREVY